MISCASKKDTINTEMVLTENPKLLFLNYTISKTAANEKSIAFHSQTITDGKLKNSNNKYTKTPSVGDLKCAQLNKSLSELNISYIKNPLIKFFEVLNDSLSFENRKIEHNRASLSLKLQLHPNTKFIEISEIIDNLNTVKQLIKTTLE